MSDNTIIAADYIPMLWSALDVKTHDSYHDKFIDYAIEEIHHLVSDNCKDFNPDYVHVEKQPDLPSSSDTIPDASYVDDDIYIICEAKANRPDLINAHTISQIRHELSLLIGSDAAYKAFVFSTPFCFENIASDMLNEALKAYHADELEDIHIVWCCELSYHSLDADNGVVKRLSDTQYANDTMAMGWAAVERIVSIDDIHFDEQNARIVRSDDEDHKIHAMHGHSAQEECYQRLLHCGYNDRPKDEATRRCQMLDARTIVERPLCYRDADGHYIVFDGNSRVALARHILELTHNHASGFRNVMIYDLGLLGKDITEQDVSLLKENKQHQQIVQHGFYQDALQIYAEYDIQNIHDIAMSKQITDSFVDVAYESIKYMKELGWDDKRMHDNYYNVSCFVKCGADASSSRRTATWKSFICSKKWKENGITADAVIDKVTSPDIQNSWKTSDIINQLLRLTVNSNPQPYDIEAVKAYLNHTHDCLTGSQWLMYLKTEKQKFQKHVSPTTEISNIRQSKSVLEGATNRITDSLNSDSKAKFTREQLHTILNEISTIQQTLGTLNNSISQMLL